MMTMTLRLKKITTIAIGLMSVLPADLGFAQQAPAPAKPSQEGYALRATTELVLVNVVARDKKGNLIRDLKQSDFTVLEDGQKQSLSSFDFENVDALATAGAADATVTGTAKQPSLLTSKSSEPVNVRDRRLMLLFFDFSAMQPEEIDRAVESAQKFVKAQMQPADLIAIVTLDTDLRINLDFTDDHSKVLSSLAAFSSGSGQGFENGDTGSSEGAAETGGSFTADDTDYNTFSADRKILALQSIMQILGKIPQKKSLIYFSNGITQSGVDNQSALRAATASAVKANVSIYPIDVRGLQAFPPGGEAQSASLHGQSAYTGAAVLNDLSSNAGSQETLSTLAEDTGGKAFFDTNDFSGVFRQVQKDTSAYYVLGYTSTNHLKDGRFRRIQVKLNRSDIRLEYRAGYYADRDFQHLQKADREEQLEDELASELPQTDVAVYAGAAVFRKDDSHYYLAVALVVPGSQIPFVTEKDKDNAQIDIIGEVLESGKFPVGHLRDTVKLAVDSAQQVRRKNVQYNTSFILAPGTYHLKFIVRENRTGRMGSFETDVQIPDLRKAPLRMSSVVLSSKRVPVTAKKKTFDPLVSDGEELVPSVTHVFTQDQHLYLQFELYDPAKAKNPSAANGTAGSKEKTSHGAFRVLTSIELLQGNRKVYESKPILAEELNAPDRKAVAFRFDLPLHNMKPGFYTCQVNVIDDGSGNFAFPRWPILIKAPESTPAVTTSTGSGN